MKTYAFEVIIEEDKWLDERIKDPVWRAYIPALVSQGASSWGYTEKEALKNLQDAVDLLVESLLEHGEELLPGLSSQTQISDLPLIHSTAN